jgi:aryl-alcohol dehydrogenase-like predicted oxidoreductase
LLVHGADGRRHEPVEPEVGALALGEGGAFVRQRIAEQRFTARVDGDVFLMPIVDLLTRFAATKNATPAQLALAWLLARKPFIVSIPGTRNIDHLRENLGALDVQLTPADLSALDADFSKLTVHGGRMNEMQMRAVERAG